MNYTKIKLHMQQTIKYEVMHAMRFKNIDTIFHAMKKKGDL